MAGVMGDLFAPAYNPTDPASVQAVQGWQDRNFSMTNPLVEQTRSTTPANPNEPRGMVDPEALRVLAQGGPYDMNARRNSIAATVQAQQAAAPVARVARPQNLSATPIGSGRGTWGLEGDWDNAKMVDPNNPSWGMYDPRFVDVSSMRGDAINPTQGYGGGGVGGAY